MGGEILGLPIMIEIDLYFSSVKDLPVVGEMR